MKKTPLIPPSEECLTVGEAAEFLGVSAWTLRNWDRVGRLRPERHPDNGYRIYRKSALAAVLAEQLELQSKKESFAQRFAWDASEGSKHFLQFYETPSYLAEAGSWFIEAGLRSGQAVLVIAYPEHTVRLERKLRARGLSLGHALDDGQYGTLEVGQTLEQILDQGTLSRDRFWELIGQRVRILSERFRGVRIVGQMVTSLWEQGKSDAAAELERLWNELASIHSFAFFWSYPLETFSSVLDGRRRIEIFAGRAVFSEPHSSPERRRTAPDLLRSQIPEVTAFERDFLENGNEAMHRISPDGRILWANAAELSLLGYDAAEFIGRNISEFHVSQGAMREILDALSRGLELQDHPVRLLKKDGSVRDFLLHANACFADGNFIYGRCFLRDAGDRVRAEETARASERRFARFMQCLPGLAWIKDIDGRYVYANDAALRSFGVVRSELYGRSDEEIFDPETAQIFRQNDRKALRSESGIQTVEVLRRSDGQEVHSLVSKFVIAGKNGEPAFIGGMAIDISESLSLPAVRQILSTIQNEPP